MDENCPQEGDELINPCNTNLERKREAEKMCGKIKDSVFRGKPASLICLVYCSEMAPFEGLKIFFNVCHFQIVTSK